MHKAVTITFALSVLLFSSAFAQTQEEGHCKKLDGDAAIAACDRAIRRNPANAELILSRGIKWQEKGDQDRAIADFDRVIDLQPEAAIGFIRRGLSRAKQNRHHLAIGDFNKAIELDEDSFAAYWLRGRSWRAVKDHDRAIADFTKSIDLNSSKDVPYFDRSESLLDKGDIALAITDLSAAIELNPNVARYYFNRGLAWADMNDFAKALADLEKFSQLAPDDQVGAKVIREIKAKMKNATILSPDTSTTRPTVRLSDAFPKIVVTRVKEDDVNWIVEVESRDDSPFELKGIRINRGNCKNAYSDLYSTVLMFRDHNSNKGISARDCELEAKEGLAGSLAIRLQMGALKKAQYQYIGNKYLSIDLPGVHYCFVYPEMGFGDLVKINVFNCANPIEVEVLTSKGSHVFPLR